jgi:hypothetical protein
MKDKGTKIQIPTSNRNKFVSINPIDDNINIDMYNIKILLVGNLFVIPIPINLPIAKAVPHLHILYLKCQRETTLKM